VSVSGPSLNAQFTYDGDGRRVRSVINGVTTIFVGNHYEVAGVVATKYFFAGTSRVAMRQNGTPYYLLSDHLGSTSLTTDANGVKVAGLRYNAWGAVRYTDGATPTKYTFTGQYSYMGEFGLLFFNARWLDPYIAQFSQPDSIITNQYNSLYWNRYTYARSNPIRYNDPSGHCTGEPNDSKNLDKECWRLYNNMEKWFPNVKLGEHTEWTTHELANLFKALTLARKAFGGQQEFKHALGTFTVYGPNSIQASLASKFSGGLAPPGYQTVILTASIFNSSNPIFYILHEIGHIFDFYNKGTSQNYHSQSFVNRWGKSCAGSGWLGCSSYESSTYPAGLVFRGYAPNPRETTVYGGLNSIDDFADSFAAAVFKMNGIPKGPLWESISPTRIRMLINLIVSY